MKRILFFIVIFFVSSFVFSQEYHWELKYVGFGWHPQDEGANADNMPLKLDDDGTFMMNIGLFTSFERYFKKDGRFSIEFMGGAYLDCAMVYDAVAHIGFRGNIINTEKHNLNAGFGPTIIVRNNWNNKVPDYIASGYWNGGDDSPFQWKTYWYAGDIEYNYKFNEYNYFSFSLIPGFPKYVVCFFGYERKLKL